MKLRSFKPEEGFQKTITTGSVIRFKRFDKELPALSREHYRNAGYDLFARLEEPLVLKPGEVARVPLNVATEIPPNAVGLLFQRSSTFRKWGIILTNSVGVVDSLYSGDGDEWQAEVVNASDRTVIVNNGDKICQAVFLPLFPAELLEVDTLGNQDRGGFGTSYDNAGDAVGKA